MVKVAFHKASKKPKTKRGRAAKFDKVMGEFKRGTLHSGSGGVVTSRDQALAIASSEAGISYSKALMPTDVRLLLRYCDRADLPRVAQLAKAYPAGSAVVKRIGQWLPGAISDAIRNLMDQRMSLTDAQLSERVDTLLASLAVVPDGEEKALAVKKIGELRLARTMTTDTWSLQSLIRELLCAALPKEEPLLAKAEQRGLRVLYKAGGHKYIRRTGSPGNYQYVYKESGGGGRSEATERALQRIMKQQGVTKEEDIDWSDPNTDRMGGTARPGEKRHSDPAKGMFRRDKVKKKEPKSKLGDLEEMGLASGEEGIGPGALLAAASSDRSGMDAEDKAFYVKLRDQMAATHTTVQAVSESAVVEGLLSAKQFDRWIDGGDDEDVLENLIERTMAVTPRMRTRFSKVGIKVPAEATHLRILPVDYNRGGDDDIAIVFSASRQMLSQMQGDY